MYGHICTFVPNYQQLTSKSDFRDSFVSIARSIGIRKGNNEKSKTKISCKNCCPRLGRLLGWHNGRNQHCLPEIHHLEQLHITQSNQHHIASRTNHQTPTMVKNSGDTVRPEQTRTMKLCCHRDVLSPASLWAFGIFFSRLPLSFESFVVPFHLMVVI